MNSAINEAKKALKKGFVPIGCVIVKNNKIIAKAYNQEFWHAEILCIQKAQKKLGKFLNNTILYSTLEPCLMCNHAIKLTRISTIIFGASKTRETYFPTEIIKYIKEETCSDIIKEFFKKRRRKN